MEEGIVAGGEISLINAASVLDKVKMDTDDAQMGVNIVRKALEAPIRKLSSNAGQDGSVIIDGVRREAARARRRPERRLRVKTAARDTVSPP